MNIQELIDELSKIEDKSIPVCLPDLYEECMLPAVFSEMSIIDSTYAGNGSHENGPFLCLGVSK